MSAALEATHDGSEVIIRVPLAQVEEMRVMLREQIAGDVEQLRWMREHDGDDRRATVHMTIPRLNERLCFCWQLAEAIGGLF